MEQSAVRRSVVFIISVASIALMGQSTFAETSGCRANPGPPAAKGMHWYYRLDRTNNRHCWYLQAAGMQVRSHEIVLLSEPQSQIVAGPPLASPSQQATAVGAFIKPGEPPIGASSASHFIARWPDLPESVDLGAYDFAPAQRDEPAENTSSHSEQLILSTPSVAPDTTSQLPAGSRNAIKFGSVFIAGAFSVLLCGGLLKLARVRISSPTKTRLKSELDSSEISLSELMRTLRRVDESLNAAEPQRYSPLNTRELAADARAPKRDQLYRLGYPG
jgi:hypothetical protein